jgi:Zn finger protein HypA/HybF involved in hydrogenase expression
MVCPQCVNERKTKAMLDMRKAKSPQQPVQPTQQRVDPEDLELERLSRQKKEQVKERPKLEIIDAERAKVTCNKCSYKFTYNRVTQNPKYCPYCGKAIELK